MSREPHLPAHASPGRKGRSVIFGNRRSATSQIDPNMAGRVQMALGQLAASGALTGDQSQRLSVRVDPGLMKAAATRAGTQNPTELVTAALALLAAPDPFVQWFLTTEERLSEDFELAI